MKSTRSSLTAAVALAAIVLSALLFAGTSACRRGESGRRAGDPDRVVATWSGGEIRRRDLPEKLLERIDSETHAAPPDQRAAVAGKLLTRWARLEILYREALRDGLDRRPDALARLAAREAEFLAKSWIESHREPVRVDPARIEAEVARRSALAGNETRRFSNIFLRVPKGDEEARAKARSRMEQIRRELEEGTAFEDLARTWSDSVTARSGGRVEWTTREPLDEKVAASVFSLKEGEVGAPVETRDGLHLFRVDEIRRPAAPDTAALRRRVEEEMTAEAVQAGDEAIRARAFDEAGVELDVAGLARPAASAPPVVARWDGGKQTLTRADFDALRASPVNVAADSPEAFARRIVVDRILASRFSSALDEKLAREVSRVRRGELILVAREERIRKVPIEVRPEEEKAFYDENVSTTGWMLARTVDLLFFEQKGEAAAGVYAEGEAVTKERRAGKSFDAVLEARRKKPGCVVKRLTGIDASEARREAERVGKELEAVERGVPSAPVYVGKGSLRLGTAGTVVEGPGLLFLRVVDVRPRPFDEVKGKIREELAGRKLAEVIGEVKKKLEEQGNLRVVPGAF